MSWLISTKLNQRRNSGTCWGSQCFCRCSPFPWLHMEMSCWFYDSMIHSSHKKRELDFKIEHAYFGVSISLVQRVFVSLCHTSSKVWRFSKAFLSISVELCTQIPAKHFPAFLQHHQDLHEDVGLSVPSIPKEIWTQKVKVCSSHEPDGSHGEVKISSKSTCREHGAGSTGWLHLTQHSWDGKRKKVSGKAMNREICFFSFYPPLPCSSLG